MQPCRPTAPLPLPSDRGCAHALGANTRVKSITIIATQSVSHHTGSSKENPTALASRHKRTAHPGSQGGKLQVGVPIEPQWRPYNSSAPHMDGLIGLPSRPRPESSSGKIPHLKRYMCIRIILVPRTACSAHEGCGDRRGGASHMLDTGSAAPCSVSPEPSSPSAFGMQDVIAPQHAPVLLLGV
jgi:hypothetical protein